MNYLTAKEALFNHGKIALQILNYQLLFLLIVFPVYSYSDWDQIKSEAVLFVAQTDSFSTPYKMHHSSLGWEDGIHISRDGLSVFCTYAPVDLLSFVTQGGTPDSFSVYKRGPEFGMDLTTNPIGASEWLHSDILYAYRSTVNDSFTTWELSGLARNFYSEGAPIPIYFGDSLTDDFAFTSNDNPTNSTDIWIAQGAGDPPSGTGAALPAPVNTDFNEDNPHIERLSPNQLVLFFDSDDRPGLGSHDIWYSTSEDNGQSWSEPNNVSTVNTNTQDHQPHLQKNINGEWMLYYSAPHTDGKLGIFSARQSVPNDWNTWTNKQLIIGAGNTGGIGEPTVTSNGDISFVVIYEDTGGSSVNRFDADPWFLPKNENVSITRTPKLAQTHPSPKIILNLSKQMHTQPGILLNTGKDFYNLQGTLIQVK